MAKTVVEILTGMLESLATENIEAEIKLKLAEKYCKLIREMDPERQTSGTDIKETVKSALKAGRTIRQVVADTGASQRMVQEISKECKQVVNEVVNDTQTECKQDVNEEDDGPDTSHLPLHKEDADLEKAVQAIKIMTDAHGPEEAYELIKGNSAADMLRQVIQEHEKPKEMPAVVKTDNDNFAANMLRQVIQEHEKPKEMPAIVKPNNDDFSAFAQVLKERRAKKETGPLF